MGVPRHPHKVKLFVGLLTGDEALISKIKKGLARQFGPIDYEGPVSDFEHTGYYEKEMGPGLKRLFLGFEKLRDLKNVYSVKLKTNSIEKRFAVRGKRRVNIDPGYLGLSKITLFSTKDYSHRIYLDKGIFAEVTLFYKDGRYNAWPWTYPDYKSDGYADIFRSLRDIYRKQLTG
jgi:hypothetical protein